MVNNYLDILAKAQNPIVLTDWNKTLLAEYFSTAIGVAIHEGFANFKLSFQLESLDLNYLNQEFIDGLAILYDNYSHTGGDGLASHLVVTQHNIDFEDNHLCLSIPVTAELTYTAKWVHPEQGASRYSITNGQLRFIDSDGNEVNDGRVSGILTMNFPANAVE